MGMNTTLKTRQIIENGFGVLGIEMIAGAQALDIRKLKPGKGTQAAHNVVRKYVKHLNDDRPLYGDNNKMAAVLKSGELLDAVEEAVGGLETY